MPLPTAAPGSSGPWACSQSRVVALPPENSVRSFQCLQRPECHTSDSTDAAAAPADHSEPGNPVSVGLSPSHQQGPSAGTRALLGKQFRVPPKQSKPRKFRACCFLLGTCQSSPAERQNFTFWVTCCRFCKGESEAQAGAFLCHGVFWEQFHFAGSNALFGVSDWEEGTFPELWHSAKHKPHAWDPRVP